MRRNTTKPSKLTPEQKAQVSSWVQDKVSRKEPQNQALNRNVSQGFPLSYAQWRLWYLDQFEPGRSTYNLSATYRLKGSLKVGVLEQALNEIIRRHDSLRTIFTMVDGEPLQVVKESLQILLEVTDLSSLNPETREEGARLRLQQAINVPFDLAQGPLIRARLFRLDEVDYVLMVGMHHIISDAWSQELLFKELKEIYSAYRVGKPSPLPPLSSQYTHYASWQRDWLDGELYGNQLSYWKNQLHDFPLLELPTDYARPKVRTHEGARVSQTLSVELTNALINLSKGLNATSFMVLFAVFNLLLHRHTGQTDLLTGTPVAGRKRMETEKLIGFFLNSLVLRVDISQSKTFKDLLQQIRNIALDAFDNQDIPFEKIIEELNPPRNLNRTPFFQVFFNLFNIQPRELELGDLMVENFPVGSTPSLFDLTVYVRNHQGRFRISFAYKTSLFSEARMSAMLTQYQRLLEQVVRDPDKALTQFTLSGLPGVQVLPDPTKPLSSEWYGSIHDKVSEHAHRSPRKTAVIDRDGTWTYQEVDQASSLIAQDLVSKGVKPGEIIAIYAHRSSSLVAAILGIHKARGVFLILDPAYPPARLHDYLIVAEPVGLIHLEAAGGLPELLQRGSSGSTTGFVIPIPEQAKFALLERASYTNLENPFPEIMPDHPACLVFTSGSTGKPKGILGRHNSLSHFLPWQCSEFELGPDDRFSMLSGLSHDPLQRDIFTSLWAGATLCIPDPSRYGDPGYLAEWMMEQAITFSHLTPPMAQFITTTAKSDTRLDSIRYFFFVGDRLSREVVAHLRQVAPQAEVINSYGSTETQRAVGYFRVPKAELSGLQDASQIYPLGHGMPDTQLLVLNEAKALCGFGELGEIYIRSPHLSLGYLKDDVQTTEKFIPNLYTNDPEDRLYRSGDLGRYRPDGDVDFAGRSDKQVKVRGFRIELKEIEAALINHPKVKEALVLQRDNEGNSNTLVAYFISEGVEPPESRALFQFLKSVLPDYMVPAAYVPMEMFPLTPNGKIDEARLPFPEQGIFNTGEGYVKPRTPEEEIVARIWSEILGVEKVGVHDNFYELGGHSLLAIQIIAAMEAELEREVPLSFLIQYPTIAGILAGLPSTDITPDTSPLVSLRSSGSKPPLYLVPPAASTAMRFERLAHYLGEDQPVYAFEYPGMDSRTEPLISIPAMAGVFIQEILKIQPQGPYYVAGMCYGAMVAFETAQQLLSLGKAVNFLGVLDSNIPPRRRKPLQYYIHHASQVIKRRLLGRQPSKEELIPPMIRRRIAGRNALTGEVYDVFVANLYAQLQYASPPYPGLITKFSTKWGVARQSTERWRKATTVGVENHLVPGSHMRLSPDDTRMLDEPNVQVVAQKLRECLEKATESR